MLEEIHFTAYKYNDHVILQFYRKVKEENIFDYTGEKLTIEEALLKYPLDKFKWISIDPNE